MAVAAESFRVHLTLIELQFVIWATTDTCSGSICWQYAPAGPTFRDIFGDSAPLDLRPERVSLHVLHNDLKGSPMHFYRRACYRSGQRPTSSQLLSNFCNNYTTPQCSFFTSVIMRQKFMSQESEVKHRDQDFQIRGSKREIFVDDTEFQARLVI